MKWLMANSGHVLINFTFFYQKPFCLFRSFFVFSVTFDFFVSINIITFASVSFDVVYSNAGARSVNLEGILTLFQNLTDIENGHNGSITIC